jgi:hypothetical protein
MLLFCDMLILCAHMVIVRHVFDPLDLIQREEVATLSPARNGVVDEEKKYIRLIHVICLAY